MSQGQQLGGWSHIVLLHVDSLDQENWGLGMLERRADVNKKSFWKEETVSEKKKGAWKDEEDLSWKKDPGSDPGDQRSHQRPEWRWTPGDTQGPWPVTTKMGHGEQWHSRNRLDFLSDCPEPAATSPLESDGKVCNWSAGGSERVGAS